MTQDLVTAARHALVALDNQMNETLLRAWFTETLGGTITETGGALRLEALGLACPGRAPFARALRDWAVFARATRADAPLAAFLHLLATRDQDTRAALIEAAVVATGGTWVPPQQPGAWGGSHLYEISLYGVLGRGSDLVDASRDWIKAATRLTRPEAA